MALSVLVNGVDQTHRIRWRSLVIDKDGSVETLALEAYNHPIVEGDILKVLQDSALEFGGEAFTVRRSPINGGRGKPVFAIRAKGWEFEARNVKVWGNFPAQGLHARFSAILDQYLAPKGWIDVGPGVGGPDLPPARYYGQRAADIFDSWVPDTGMPWRVNGDRWAAFSTPGDFSAPFAFTDVSSQVLIGGQTERSQTRQVSRLFVSMGGSGTVTHTETHIATGAEVFWPLNVLPAPGRASLSAAALIGATSLALQGLPANLPLAAGTGLDVGATIGYETAALATTDAEGKVTVTLTGGLAAAAAEGDPVTVDAGAFVRLRVNGVDTALGFGSPWSYEQNEAGFRRTSPAAAGTQVTAVEVVSLPATIRVWNGDTRDVYGQWNYANIRDGEAANPTIADLANGKAWAQTTLATRTNVPKQLRVATFGQGLYPWQRATVAMPSQDAAGPYLIQRTRLVDVGKSDKRPRIEVTMLEGDAIGPDWRKYLRAGLAAAAGVSAASSMTGSVGPGSSTPPPVGGSGLVPTGSSLSLGGDNDATVLASTTWQDVRGAIPRPLGGSGMAGTWRLRVPVYQLSAGTVQVALYDQTSGIDLATVTTTAVGTAIDNAFFAYLTTTFTAPGTVDDTILRVRTTAGSRDVVVGKATVVKL